MKDLVYFGVNLFGLKIFGVKKIPPVNVTRFKDNVKMCIYRLDKSNIYIKPNMLGNQAKYKTGVATIYLTF